MKPIFGAILNRDALLKMRQQYPGYKWLSDQSQAGLKIDMFDGLNMGIPGKRKTCSNNAWAGMLRKGSGKMVHCMSIPWMKKIAVD